MEKIEYYKGMNSTYSERKLYQFSLNFKKDKILVYNKDSNGTTIGMNTTYDWHLENCGLTLDLSNNIPGNNGLRNNLILSFLEKNYGYMIEQAVNRIIN